MLPGLNGSLDLPERSEVATGGRLALAVLVAAAVVSLDLAARASVVVGSVAAFAALVVVLLAVRPLVPTGTLVVRRGLPAVIALRGAIAATFFATEIYLPYLLQEHYDVPPWLSGATLTVGALGWAGASQVQARLGSRLGHHAALRAGATLLLLGIAGVLVAAALELTAFLIGAAWVLAGAGMGLMYPRIGSLVLAASSERDQGRNTSAMSISDAVGGATAISLTGLLFTAVGPASDLAPFVAVLALTSVLALAALLVSRRTVGQN
jgi:MFS family permease